MRGSDAVKLAATIVGGLVVVLLIVAVIAVERTPCGVLGGSCGPDFLGPSAALERDRSLAMEECQTIPAATGDRIVAGIAPTIPEGWPDQSGARLLIERVWLTAYPWPPSSHIVQLTADLQNGEKVYVGLLLDGSLESPHSITFLTKNRSITNPTSFERAIHDAWTYAAIWRNLFLCAEEGILLGPYDADQIGSGL